MLNVNHFKANPRKLHVEFVNNDRYSDNFEKIVKIIDMEKYSPQGCVMKS